MPLVPKVDGKAIRSVRRKTFQNMSQPKFAAMLSEATGEHISSQRLRDLRLMENEVQYAQKSLHVQ